MNTPRISLIAALDDKNGIGKEGKLVWHLPGDLPRFKQLTLGHPIIMGRKTFESIGRILPGRTNIIVSRDPMYTVEGATTVTSIEQAITVAENLDKEEIFIIGGGQIYKEVIGKSDRLYLTLVKGDFTCDAFFPEYSQFTKVIAKDEKEGEGYTFTYITLEK